jgi:hypothetical protein
VLRASNVVVVVVVFLFFLYTVASILTLYPSSLCLLHVRIIFTIYRESELPEHAKGNYEGKPPGDEEEEDANGEGGNGNGKVGGSSSSSAGATGAGKMETS